MGNSFPFLSHSLDISYPNGDCLALAIEVYSSPVTYISDQISKVPTKDHSSAYRDEADSCPLYTLRPVISPLATTNSMVGHFSTTMHKCVPFSKEKLELFFMP